MAAGFAAIPGRGIEIPAAFAPFVVFGSGHFPGQVHALHARERGRQADRFWLVDFRAGNDGGALGAFFAQNSRQAACIDVGNRHHAVALQVGRQALRRPPVAVDPGAVTDDQARSHRSLRFLIFRVTAGVADMRVGQGHDLTRVGGVGQDLLVTGHRRIENRFADGVPACPDTAAAKNAAVL